MVKYKTFPSNQPFSYKPLIFLPRRSVSNVGSLTLSSISTGSTVLLEKKQFAEVDYLHYRGSTFSKQRPCNLFTRSLIDPSQHQKYSAWMINIHIGNARSKIIIVIRTK